MIFRLTSNRNLWIMYAGDSLMFLAAYFCSYLIRFGESMPANKQALFWQTVWWMAPLKIVCFFWFDLYKGMWRYFSVHELMNTGKACALAFAVTIIIILGMHRFEGFSRSVFLMDLVLSILLVGGFRLAIRLMLVDGSKGWRWFGVSKFNRHLKNMVIIGAGSAGEKLLREIYENTTLNYNLVGFVDDDPKKFKSRLHGVPVIGGPQDLKTIVREQDVHMIAIAVPSASARQMRRLISFCKSTDLPFKTLPGLGELIEGKVTASAMREVRYEDLLGRPPVELDELKIGSYVSDKRVMVTGGAGSIGSELCRQIARFKPRQLIIVERNESGLYELELALQRNYPGLDTVAVLGSVQNYNIMMQIFEMYCPETVFHAAAYKHVPMMENHPWEAVFNNVVGSGVIVRLCATKGVARCVMVSTDKAVRPTNVMGATKRMMELITTGYAAESSCRFMAVRFGNVLGSAGSVLPVFKAQIEAGGPVTVTDPNVTRYFMTIPEACRLILQAGGIGRGNEIFVLKMGTPVKIDSMARDMITLSGFVPDKEIEIKYTGLRPGEKLYEELITEGENVMPTRHKDIMVLKANDYLTSMVIERHIETLVELALKKDAYGIKKALWAVVPEYCPQMEGESTPKVAKEVEGCIDTKKRQPILEKACHTKLLLKYSSK